MAAAAVFSRQMAPSPAFGPALSSKSPAFGATFSSPTAEHYRTRLRTDSYIGMPSTPWVQNEVAYLPMLPPSMPVHWEIPEAVMMQQMAMQAMCTPAVPNMPGPPGTFLAPPPAFDSIIGTAVLQGAAGDDWRTTVMLKNLPKSFSREGLLSLLDSKGFQGAYDFVYMPFNFDTFTNLNHAFVNMIMPEDVERLWAAFDGFSDWEVPHEEACKLAWNDKQQGLAALIGRYRDSPVMHNSVPDGFKPILFCGGRPVPFPAPTEAVKMLRL